MLLACSALVAIPVAAQEAPTVVHFGKWGVDLATRDTSVKPGDDFQRYAAGKWMDENEIPADKSQNGVGSELNDRNQEQLQSIVMSAPKDSQLGAFYASFMDEARAEQLDAAPLKPELDRVAAIQTKADMLKHMAETQADFGGTLFGLGIFPGLADPTRNIVYLFQAGMGLPDRDYYLLDKNKAQRDA